MRWPQVALFIAAYRPKQTRKQSTQRLWACGRANETHQRYARHNLKLCSSLWGKSRDPCRPINVALLRGWLTAHTKLYLWIQRRAFVEVHIWDLASCPQRGLSIADSAVMASPAPSASSSSSSSTNRLARCTSGLVPNIAHRHHVSSEDYCSLHPALILPTTSHCAVCCHQYHPLSAVCRQLGFRYI